MPPLFSPASVRQTLRHFMLCQKHSLSVADTLAQLFRPGPATVITPTLDLAEENA